MAVLDGSKKEELDDTSVMKMGGRSDGRGRALSARTSGVTVAVNSSVCRFADGGNAERHVSTSGSIEPLPEVSRRSASSSTTTLTLDKPRIVSVPDV